LRVDYHSASISLIAKTSFTAQALLILLDLHFLKLVLATSQKITVGKKSLIKNLLV